MQLATGDLWSLPDADAICIPTNGMLHKTSGGPERAVMGSGVAFEAKTRYPGLDLVLGQRLNDRGNQCHILIRDKGVAIVSFPTKWDWRDKSHLGLIRSSCLQLVFLAEQEAWRKVSLPRLGAGLGRLDWETEVRPSIEPLLDDRFWIVTLATGGAARSANATRTGQPAGRKENRRAVDNGAPEPHGQDSAEERHYGIG